MGRNYLPNHCIESCDDYIADRRDHHVFLLRGQSSNHILSTGLRFCARQGPAVPSILVKSSTKLRSTCKCGLRNTYLYLLIGIDTDWGKFSSMRLVILSASSSTDYVNSRPLVRVPYVQP